MENFDLQKAKAGYPVCLETGEDARILCFDKKGDYPLVVLVSFLQQYEATYHYDLKGESPCYPPLKMKPIKKQGFIAIYKNCKNESVSSKLYKTEEEILRCTYEPSIQKIIKVEWEE